MFDDQSKTVADRSAHRSFHSSMMSHAIQFALVGLGALGAIGAAAIMGYQVDDPRAGVLGLAVVFLVLMVLGVAAAVIWALCIQNRNSVPMPGTTNAPVKTEPGLPTPLDGKRGRRADILELAAEATLYPAGLVLGGLTLFAFGVDVRRTDTELIVALGGGMLISAAVLTIALGKLRGKRADTLAKITHTDKTQA